MEDHQQSCSSTTGLCPDENRTAIFFSGRVYGFDEAYLKRTLKSIEASFNQKVDIFISGNTHQESFDQFVEIFKPVKYEFRDFVIPPKYLNYSSQGRFTIITDACKMIFHIYNSFELIKQAMKENNNIKYNIVVFYRADILSDDDLNLNSNIEPNTVYIPSGYDAYGGLNGIFAYGDFNSMELYSSIWADIPYLVEGHNCPMHPETLLLFQLTINKANVKRFYYKYKLNPRRKPGIILDEQNFQ